MLSPVHSDFFRLCSHLVPVHGARVRLSPSPKVNTPFCRPQHQGYPTIFWKCVVSFLKVDRSLRDSTIVLTSLSTEGVAKVAQSSILDPRPGTESGTVATSQITVTYMKILLDSDWLTRQCKLQIKILESDLQSTGVGDWNVIKNFRKPRLHSKNFRGF